MGVGETLELGVGVSDPLPVPLPVPLPDTLELPVLVGLGEGVCVLLAVVAPVAQAVGEPVPVLEPLLPIVADGVGVAVAEGVSDAVDVLVAEMLLVPLLLVEAEPLPDELGGCTLPLAEPVSVHVPALLSRPAADPLADPVAATLPLPPNTPAADAVCAAGVPVPCSSSEALAEAVEELEAEGAALICCEPLVVLVDRAEGGVLLDISAEALPHAAPKLPDAVSVTVLLVLALPLARASVLQDAKPDAVTSTALAVGTIGVRELNEDVFALKEGRKEGVPEVKAEPLALPVGEGDATTLLVVLCDTLTVAVWQEDSEGLALAVTVALAAQIATTIAAPDCAEEEAPTGLL